tara:strand:- start:463 stop:1284 length:822 start_codon:yes stop_codon:yes gene_type:complete
MTPAATAFQNELLSHSSVEQHLQTHKALLKEMHRICLPILNTTEIDYISYTKQYEDKMIHYTTETKEQTEFKLSHPNFIPHCSHIEKTSVMSWDQHFNKPFFNDFLKVTKLNNGILLLYKHPEYNESISIGTRSSTIQLLLNYLNEPESMVSLGCYIKEACRRASKKLNERTITFTQKQDLNKIKVLPKITLPSLRSSKYIIVGNNGETLLTRMEYFCFRNIIALQTSRESGKTLDLSPKTIEAHIAKLKKKLGVDSKSEMFEIAKNNGIISV